MNCREDFPVVRERWGRFGRMLKTENQPAMNEPIGFVIGAVDGGVAMRPLVKAGIAVGSDRGRW